MAKDAVDEPARAMDARVPESFTPDLPLVGAEGYHALWNQRQSLADGAGIHVARVEHLLNRYGSLIHELLDMIRADRSLAEALPRARVWGLRAPPGGCRGRGRRPRAGARPPGGAGRRPPPAGPQNTPSRSRP